VRDDEPFARYEPASWSAEPAPARPYFVRPKPSVLREYVRPALLFLLTAGTVYLHGGLQLVVAAMGIMLSHEMGHYLACRYYKVDATLPHFLPAPIISLVGTFGAFIRIRGPIPDRKALFDIGVAGPLAGFVVCLPFLYLGAHELEIGKSTPNALMFNEPLILHWMFSWFAPPLTLGPGEVAVIGPYGLAAWFGLLLTALNLMPVGQLDGGHAVYALMRERAALISRIASWLCLALLYFGPSYLIWWVLLRLLARPHPPTIDDEQPVGRARAAIGILCVAVFVLCFRPDPIEFSWHDAWKDLYDWWIT